MAKLNALRLFMSGRGRVNYRKMLNYYATIATVNDMDTGQANAEYLVEEVCSTRTAYLGN